MNLTSKIEVGILDHTKEFGAKFYTPQVCQEMILVEFPPKTIDFLFVHHFQTDQLVAVKGHIVMIVLQNRHYQYILLKDSHPQLLKIPPGIPHAAVNLSAKPCLVANAVLRHGSPHRLDSRPLNPPFAYDMPKIKSLLSQ
jgi:dTDP-4-dehydrorhamnose 3,5-epimerase-like enzyme